MRKNLGSEVQPASSNRVVQDWGKYLGGDTMVTTTGAVSGAYSRTIWPAGKALFARPAKSLQRARAKCGF